MLTTTDKMFFLGRILIFRSLSLPQLQVLASHLEEQHFLDGEVIVDEGDFSQEIYIIVSGRVRIVKDYRQAGERTLSVLGPGDVFGEMAVFESAPRSATVVAEEKAEMVVLGPEKFKQAIFQRPEMAFEIFRELSARIRQTEASTAHAGTQKQS